MGPAVTLVVCLMATLSCFTTAQITTSINNTSALPNPTTNSPITTPNMTSDANIMSTNSTTMAPSATNTTINSPNTTTKITNMPFNATSMSPDTTTMTPNPTDVSLNATSISPNVNMTDFTTTTPQAPAHGSCANPDLCCSGVNNMCHRVSCYCDVACLRFKDCCPDFNSTCVTVNDTTKPSPFPQTGSCSNPPLCCNGTNFNCFRGCFCDDDCKFYKDCCPDYNSTCNTPVFTTKSPIFPNISTNSPTSPSTSSPAPPKDVLSILTNLEVELLAEESSTEEERQAALLQFAALLESSLRANNTDIYSFEVLRIKPLSPCD